ncbi:MAG: indolepyruvate oxidoreductase subunit beta [Spirochaetes bacterium]|nr:indolepyruvate oxidoreductase subunit beta [Spirochaetota bacterium]
MVKNILLNGVGGQGILLVSEILVEALLLSGFDVKKNEIHGMSQRGGVVNSHIRYGDKIYSPIIPVGEADIIISFEYCETLRFINYLKENGLIIFNLQKIIPVSVSSGKASYPQNIEDELTKYYIKYDSFDAFSYAKNFGMPKATNIALLAYSSKYLEDIKDEIWEKAMRKYIKEKFFDKNFEIFKSLKKSY